ncbi:WD repeat and FYVE domain-containing protein 3 [Toxocara canis]|uniref:WD repeat and FYVE domain-containing protein 3 n=1 Tax=Toxocara canis TaxID=6265 RepID=A0A0B2V5K2_TOXCA|nr:WD repeat and FYVE domain-containing protein 3 [Toxocara canis]
MDIRDECDAKFFSHWLKFIPYVTLAFVSDEMGESERALTLLHLRKTFSEYCKVPLSGVNEGERKFDRVLPLFCKVMSMYPCSEEIVTQFRELCPFAGHLCRHLVQEMRVRAANQSTELAALSISTFLLPEPTDSRGWLLLQSAHYVMSMYPCSEEIVTQFRELCPFAGHLCRHLVQEMRVRAANQSTELAALSISTFLLPEPTDSRGWLLLQSAHYVISTGHLPVIDAVCKASLPSTLVKALYLFFDLPPTTDEKVADLRRTLFTRFLSLMEKLCEYKCVGEELARKDDLFLLFAGACCTCPVENVSWRKAASQLLITVVSKALSPAVIKYIHAKGCVAHFLSSVSKEGDHLGAHERVEMIICILCVIKDSAMVTAVLVQDFAQADGYSLLRNFVLRNEREEDGIRNVLLMLMSVVTSGVVELRPMLSPSLVVLPSFTLPSPSGSGLSVRNLDAFRLLFQIFVQVL